MKRVLVKSVHDAFGYVMEHYYPFGMADEAAEQGALTDTYAIISIQDSHVPKQSGRLRLRCSAETTASILKKVRRISISMMYWKVRGLEGS